MICKRMGADINKQFLKLGGKAVIVRAAESCLNFLDSLPAETKTGLHIICAEDEREEMKKVLDEAGLKEKITSFIPGGRTRAASVYNGLTALEEQVEDPSDCLVMVHDGARCLTTKALFSRCRETAVLYGASCPGIAVQDTLRKAFAPTGQDPVLYETVPREMLYAMQTPQTFHLDRLLKANRLARQKIAEGEISLASLTDDVSIAQLADITVRLTEGEISNRKITRPEDLRAAEAYIKAGLV